MSDPAPTPAPTPNPTDPALLAAMAAQLAASQAATAAIQQQTGVMQLQVAALMQWIALATPLVQAEAPSDAVWRAMLGSLSLNDTVPNLLARAQAAYALWLAAYPPPPPSSPAPR